MGSGKLEIPWRSNWRVSKYINGTEYQKKQGAKAKKDVVFNTKQ